MNAPRTTQKARFGLSSAILLACATVSCLLIGVLGSRIHARWDLTSTRQHTLAERTKSVLAEVTEPTTIVVSADLSALDRESVRMLSDLLGEFTRERPLIRSTWIDTSSASAMRDLGTLLASLTEPIAPQLAAQKAAIEQVAADTVALVASLRSLSDGLKALAEAGGASTTGATASFSAGARDQAGLVRTVASSVEPLADALRASAGHTVAGVSVPAVDAARSAASDPLDKAARAASGVEEFAGAVLTGRPGTAAEHAARELLEQAARTRDQAARSADVIARLRPSDPLIVARVLEHSSAVLVTTSRGTIAVDFGRLFPSGPLREQDVSAGRDVLFAGEQLITTAIEGLFGPPAPIIVFVHAQTVTLLDDRGEPTPQAAAAFRTLFERMRLTRATPAEWPVAIRPRRPELASIDASGERPVVWVVLPSPPRTTTDGRQSSASAAAERAERIRKLGEAVKSLLDPQASGEHLLVCIEPSDLPSLGEPDPVARALEQSGIRVDSARPLIRTESSPQGPLTWTFQMVSNAQRGHPIGRAIDGMRLVLPWAMSLVQVEQPETTFSPILTVPRVAGLWGESNWMLLRDLVGRGLARPLTPLLLAETPVLNEGRDLTPPEGAAGFVVAAATERRRPSHAPAPRGITATTPQRLVVVASPEWLSDGYTQASEDISGRRVLLFPGNLELFDAAVSWLAGRDERIAQGPRGGDTPRIGPIPDGPMRALRIILIVGLPALVLILGGLQRLLRG